MFLKKTSIQHQKMTKTSSKASILIEIQLKLAAKVHIIL